MVKLCQNTYVNYDIAFFIYCCTIWPHCYWFSYRLFVCTFLHHLATAEVGLHIFALSGHSRTMPTNKKLKRTSYACSICCYRTDSAMSLGNHKREHDKQLWKETEFEFCIQMWIVHWKLQCQTLIQIQTIMSIVLSMFRIMKRQWMTLKMV